MNTINVKVGETTDSINLGRRGENEATEVVFDVSSLVSTYGAGNPVLLAKRAQDSTAYPVSATSEEDSVTWLVNSADSAQASAEEAQTILNSTIYIGADGNFYIRS